MSQCAHGCALTRPAGIVPGQLAIIGTRMPPFIEIALDAAQPAGALEELRIGAAFLVRAVVADEHDQRPAVEPARRAADPTAAPMSRSMRTIIAANAAFGVGCER